MGYDLVPRNKAVGDFYFGAFGWGWFLDQGAGWPIGYFKGLTVGSYHYTETRNGGSPASNDGFRVTAKEAKEMAKLARWIASDWDAVALHHAKLPESVQKERTDFASRSSYLYRTPVRADWVVKIKEFADWAEKSAGFGIR